MRIAIAAALTCSFLASAFAQEEGSPYSRVESNLKFIGGDIEQLGTSSASVNYSKTGNSASTPSTVDLSGSVAASFGTLTNRFDYEKNRTTAPQTDIDFSGWLAAEASFRDTLLITPNDSGLNGNAVRVEFLVTGDGASSIGSVGGPDGRWTIRHSVSLGKYDPEDPTNSSGFVDTFSNIISLSSNSDGDFLGNATQASAGPFTDTLTLYLTLGDVTGFFGDQILIGEMIRSASQNGSLISGTLSANYSTSFRINRLLDGNGDEIDVNDFTFTSGQNIDYFAVPEPRGLVLLTLAAAVAGLVWRRQRVTGN